MKKKLFTLLTLLCLCVTGAWGDNENLKADDASGNSYTGTAYNFAATGSITTDKSQATAADDNTLHFNKGWLPNGSSSSSSNYYTFTAKKDISSLKVYYTMSDSKFGSNNQSKGGSFKYKIGDASEVTITAVTGDNKVAYVATINSINKDDVIKFYSSANRLVIFGVYATYTAAPEAISFDPAAGSVETGSNITLSSSGANTILYQWGESAIDGNGDWTGATPYDNEHKPVVPSVGSSNNVLSVKATNTYGSTYGSATYTITAAKTVTTTEINSTGITNLDVKSGTAAGTLTASVTAGGSPVGGATVTWASSDESIVKVGETTGVVTLVAAGDANITATYAGDETYAASFDVYAIEVVDTRKQVTLSFSTVSLIDYNYDDETLTAPTLTAKDQSNNTIDLAELPELSFAVDKEDVVTVNATTGAITAANTNNFGTSTVTVSFPGNSNYKSAASKSYTVTRAPMLYQVKFDNGFEGFIEEGTKRVNVFYMAGTSAPAQTGTIKKADGYTANVVGNTVVLTKDTHTKTYNIVATAKAPFEGAGKQTFSAVPDYVASVYGYTSDKGLKFSKKANLDESKTDWTREAKGNSRLYFFVGAAKSITLTHKGDSRAVKVRVNGGDAVTETGTFTVNLNEDQLNMIEIQSNQTSGDGGFKDMTLTNPKAAVTVGANGYTTFASTNKLDLTDENRPEGLKAYTATREGSSLTFNKLNQTVPAGTGLLLLGETKGGTYYIPIASESTAVEENALIGVTSPIAKQSNPSGNYYFVMKKATNANDPLKFAPITTTKEVTIPAGKAYIEVPNSELTSARELSYSFDEGNATGVNGVEEIAPVTKTRKVVKNGRLVIETANGEYSVSGARVK